ncbi:OmpA family protein [Frigidibacter sp. ROC022]|uniref:OmpA family protein n=1 Tax=Frigidibacter sp. ROC022 TaxID=2971796 RepID=UPI00215A169B|nr:OmpA family protein [Frigidibacter sp. ROC022]MCR8722814.1 OmpA family protein [Frigidibacter sp. ROC022]
MILRKAGRALMAGGLALVAALVVSVVPAAADDGQAVKGQKYVPTIWIDPDGCEHWVMDDGWEGYMDIRLTRDGKPVCHRSEVCGVMSTDQLFATDKYSISASGRAALQQFFKSAQAYGFLVIGHTDSRASDAYNMRLSQNRANAVAAVGQSVGARIVGVRGMGEREPRASNATAAGMQQNRRVEIVCIK